MNLKIRKNSLKFWVLLHNIFKNFVVYSLQLNIAAQTKRDQIENVFYEELRGDKIVASSQKNCF